MRNVYIQIRKFIHSELMAFSTHTTVYYTGILDGQGKKILYPFCMDFVQRTIFLCKG